MNRHHEPDPRQVKAALATLVATEPSLPTGTADIERRGRRLAQRRLGGVVGSVLVLAAGGVFAVSLLGGSGPVGQVAQPADSTTDPTTGSQLPTGFPIGAAVEAVGAALPAGASLGEIPMDIHWRAGGLLDVPVTTAEGAAKVVVQVDGGICSATVEPVEALPADDLTAIAASVCGAWDANDRLPVIPYDPAGAEQPDLANQ